SDTRPLEIPYLLIQPRDSVQIAERKAPLLNLSQVGGKTEFLLDLGDAAQPVNGLTIEIDERDRNYERTVTVEGADRRDAEEWNLLTSDGYTLDKTRAVHRLTVGKVDFPQSRFHFYKVSIDNEGEPPLRVVGARLIDRVEVRPERKKL